MKHERQLVDVRDGVLCYGGRRLRGRARDYELPEFRARLEFDFKGG